MDVIEVALDDEHWEPSSVQSTNSRMSSIAEKKVNEKWAVVFVTLIILLIGEILITKFL